ncbi:MAG: hypothetical protein IJB32_02890 [Clostridia bacterium]|nr:hypothetical protein [Clostridia bacterium]
MTNIPELKKVIAQEETAWVNPSGCAAFMGPCGLLKNKETKKYCIKHGLTKSVLKNSTQIAWATGGKMIPEEVKKEYLETYL